jgi:hypothetical protein
MGYYEGRASIELTIEQLNDAVMIIDRKFGKGFSERNPALLGSVVNSLGTNYLATTFEAKLKLITQIIEKQSV